VLERLHFVLGVCVGEVFNVLETS